MLHMIVVCGVLANNNERKNFIIFVNWRYCNVQNEYQTIGKYSEEILIKISWYIIYILAKIFVYMNTRYIHNKKTVFPLPLYLYPEYSEPGSDITTLYVSHIPISWWIREGHPPTSTPQTNTRQPTNCPSVVVTFFLCAWMKNEHD